MSPPTAAKHAGLDWKSLTPREREIVTVVTRVLDREREKELSSILFSIYERVKPL